MARSDVFNRRKHRLLRSRIGVGEIALSTTAVVLLVATIAWVLGTRSDYDRSTRELPIEALVRDAKPINLYHQPFKPWHEAAVGGSVDAPGSLASASADDLNPFPRRLLDGGWRPAKRVRRFGPDNLYEKINGEAPKFLKQGFVALHVAEIAGPDNTRLSIELFDQGSERGSVGVFASHIGGSRQPQTLAGVSFVMTGIGVIGRVGQYFFRAAGDSISEPVQAKSQALVEVMSSLGTQAQAEVLSIGFLARALKVAEADVSYEQENAFQFDFARDFWFVFAFRDAAEERAREGRLFLHAAADPASAEDLLRQLVEEQSFDYETLDGEQMSALEWPPGIEREGLSILRHPYLQTFFVAGRRGRFVMGAERIVESNEAMRAVAKLDRVLSERMGGQDGER